MVKGSKKRKDPEELGDAPPAQDPHADDDDESDEVRHPRHNHARGRDADAKRRIWTCSMSTLSGLTRHPTSIFTA